MRLRNSAYTVTSIALSIVTLMSFWLFSLLFAEPSLFYLGFPFILVTFLFSYILLDRNDVLLSLKFTNASIPKIFIGAITASSVFAVLFIPTYTGSILEWMNIPFINWLRYVASILLAMFLPGYFLLKIFDTKNSLKIYTVIPLAYILSMLITFSIGFGLLLNSDSISSWASLWLVIINLSLMAIYYIRTSLNRLSQKIVSLNLTLGGAALLATVLLVFVGNIYVMNSTLPLSQGDMWRHHGQALQYSKGFPVHAGMLIPDYPYLFQIYLATFFQLSGLPSPISYQALFVLSFVPLLSFYSFLKGWIPEKKVRSVAMLLIPLLGFGSLYAINLKTQDSAMSLISVLSNTISKTYDINDIMIITPAHSNLVAILYITLPTLLIFLYLLRKKLDVFTKVFISSVLVAVSFLGHPDAPFFMGLALLLHAIIMKGENTKTISFGGILGLLIVPVVDFSAPARIFLFGTGGMSSGSTLTYLVTFFLFALSYSVSALLRHVNFDCGLVPKNLKKVFSSFVSRGIIFLYVFAFITWLFVLPDYNAFMFGHYNFTPFFVWPIRFGPIGLFSILCLVFYFVYVIGDKRLTFFLALASTGFAMEQIANYYSLYPSYRFATFALLGVVVLAAYFVVKISSLLIGKRRILLTILLISLMIPGMLSASLFYYDRGTLKPNINNYELNALDFVRQNLPSNASVLTFTSDSEAKLETFAGVNTVQICYRWSDAFLTAQDVSVVLYLLGNSNVKYLYLSTYDWQKLNSSNSVLRDLLPYFPISFYSEFVKISEVPQLSTPSKSSDLSIINFISSSTLRLQNLAENETLLTSIPSFLMLNYSINSLPLQENISKVVINDFGDISAWYVYEGSGKIATGDYDSSDQMHSLSVKDIQADKSGYFAVGEKGNWNFNGYDSLRLWIKVPSDMQDIVKVILRGNDHKIYMQWFVNGFPRDKWVQLDLPFNNPTGKSNTTLNLADIQHIDVGFATKPFAQSSYFKIADLVLTRKYLPILNSQEITHLLTNTSVLLLTHDPNADLNMLIPWVEAGNRILVLNDFQNSGAAFFSEFLKLKLEGQIEYNEIELINNTNLSNLSIPIVSSDEPDVTAIVWYRFDGTPTSPFAFSKKVGLGEIIYAALPSKLTEPNSEYLLIISGIINYLINLTKIHTDKISITNSQLPSYSMVESYFNTIGSTKIITAQLLNAQPTDASIQVETESSSVTFENVTINSLAAYSSTIIFSNASIEFGVNSLYDGYTFLSSIDNDQRNSIKLSAVEGTIKINSLNGKANLSFKKANIVINASNLSFFALRPVIESQGETYLNSATVTYGAPYTPLAGAIRKGITIKGTTTIVCGFSTSNVMIIDNFSYSGTATKDPSQVDATFTIPWMNLLIAMLLSFLTLIPLFALAKFFKKKVLKNLHLRPKTGDKLGDL